MSLPELIGQVISMFPATVLMTLIICTCLVILVLVVSIAKVKDFPQ